MFRRIGFWHVIVLSLLLLTVGCAKGTPTPYPSDVNWEAAVEILHTGEVEMVMQAHSLDVTLIMKGGSEIHTVEPTIDAIFAEIDQCGQPCSEIIMATE